MWKIQNFPKLFTMIPESSADIPEVIETDSQKFLREYSEVIVDIVKECFGTSLYKCERTWHGPYEERVEYFSIDKFTFQHKRASSIVQIFIEDLEIPPDTLQIFLGNTFAVLIDIFPKINNHQHISLVLGIFL